MKITEQQRKAAPPCIKLLVETPELKAGAILEKELGYRKVYICKITRFLKPEGWDFHRIQADAVLNSPHMFEVVVPVYVTPDEAKEFQKLMKLGGKNGPAKVS